MGLLVLTSGFAAEPKLDPKEAKAIAKEAYIYGLPMVLNYKTMHSYVIDKNSPEYKGEFNYMQCESRVYTPEDRANSLLYGMGRHENRAAGSDHP
jgi:hypothetical protein